MVIGCVVDCRWIYNHGVGGMVVDAYSVIARYPMCIIVTAIRVFGKRGRKFCNNVTGGETEDIILFFCIQLA